jgi:hypothetical protein
MKHEYEYLSCDKCGYSEENAGCIVKSYRINVGKSMDASGNGYNIDWEYVDLCDSCVARYKLENSTTKIYES